MISIKLAIIGLLANEETPNALQDLESLLLPPLLGDKGSRLAEGEGFAVDGGIQFDVVF